MSDRNSGTARDDPYLNPPPEDGELYEEPPAAAENPDQNDIPTANAAAAGDDHIDPPQPVDYGIDLDRPYEDFRGIKETPPSENSRENRTTYVTTFPERESPHCNRKVWMGRFYRPAAAAIAHDIFVFYNHNEPLVNYPEMLHVYNERIPRRGIAQDGSMMPMTSQDLELLRQIARDLIEQLMPNSCAATHTRKTKRAAPILHVVAAPHHHQPPPPINPPALAAAADIDFGGIRFPQLLPADNSQERSLIWQSGASLSSALSSAFRFTHDFDPVPSNIDRQWRAQLAKMTRTFADTPPLQPSSSSLGNYSRLRDWVSQRQQERRGDQPQPQSQAITAARPFPDHNQLMLSHSNPPSSSNFPSTTWLRDLILQQRQRELPREQPESQSNEMSTALSLRQANDRSTNQPARHTSSLWIQSVDPAEILDPNPPAATSPMRRGFDPLRLRSNQEPEDRRYLGAHMLGDDQQWQADQRNRSLGAHMLGDNQHRYLGEQQSRHAAASNRYLGARILGDDQQKFPQTTRALDHHISLDPNTDTRSFATTAQNRSFATQNRSFATSQNRPVEVPRQEVDFRTPSGSPPSIHDHTSSPVLPLFPTISGDLRHRSSSPNQDAHLNIPGNTDEPRWGDHYFPTPEPRRHRSRSPRRDN